MKRLFIIGGLVIVIGLGLVLITRKPSTTKDDMAHPAASQQQMHILGPKEAEMSDFKFGPAKLTVKKGDTVTWHNRDSAHHNVVFDTGVLKGQGGKLIGQDETYEFTFKEAGTFDYHCAPHPYMKATIEVTE